MRITGSLVWALTFCLATGLTPATADVSGPRAPSNCINHAALPGLSWNFPERAKISDNLRVVKVLEMTNTQLLRCTGFGFDVPTGEMINGIVVENEVSASSEVEVIRDFAQRIVINGNTGEADRSHPDDWPLLDQLFPHGSPTDRWGECWCAAPRGTGCGDPRCGNVNNDDFGAALAAVHLHGVGATARVDQVRITVHHGVPTPSVTSTITPTVTPTPTITMTPTVTSTPTATSALAECPDEPNIGCATSNRAQIRLQESANPAARRLEWRWTRGVASLAQFGDPLQSTSFSLCIYDDAALVGMVRVMPGGRCGRDDCWREKRGRGFAYANKDANDMGIALLDLTAGNGSADLHLKAKGRQLALPLPMSPNGTVTVQLVKNRSAGLECWTSRFRQPARHSTQHRFDDSFPE